MSAYRLQSWEGSDASRITDSASGIFVREYWQADGLNDPDDVNSAYGMGVPSRGTPIGPPLGSQDPPPRAIVISVTRVAVFQATASFSCIYAVDGRASFDTPQYTYSAVVQNLGDDNVPLPNATAHTATVGPQVWTPVNMNDGTMVTWPRAVFKRIITRVVTGYSIDDVQEFDSNNVGRAANINNIPHIYRGTTAVRDQTGFMQVRIVLQTTAAIPAIPANTFQGYSVAMPALPQLGRYSYFQASPTVAPIITAHPIQRFALLAEQIPWL